MGEADVHIPQGSEIGQVVTVFALQLGKKERRKTVCREGYGLIVPWRLRGHFIPYRSRGPDPAGAHHLFSLATAGLVQNGAPLDLGLVISVDGVCDVQGILEDLPSGSVHHGLLNAKKKTALAIGNFSFFSFHFFSSFSFDIAFSLQSHD